MFTRHRSSTISFLASLFCWIISVTPSFSQAVTPLCNPKIVANETVATPAQRLAAGQLAQPPITDLANGFAWPDTPLGVVKSGAGYAFFGSDGAHHSRQFWDGKWYRGHGYGSVTRTLGTLNNLLSGGPPLDVVIDSNPDPSVNPFYSSYDYMGGGPVYRVPAGMQGAGGLLLVYHAEIPTITTHSFYSVLGLAASSDEGASWTDLGEIISINQAYRSDLDGYDIGDPPLVTSPDGKYLYIYFDDWLANGTTHWGNTVTQASVARAAVADVLAAAFGSKPHAATFEKYYANNSSPNESTHWRLQPGIGGYSTDLNPNAGLRGEMQVAYSSALGRYVMIVDEGSVLGYAESIDGIQWTSPVIWLHDFRNDPDQPNTYAMPVGKGDDPRILGNPFLVYYTRYPTTGAGWPGASVGRFTVACH